MRSALAVALLRKELAAAESRLMDQVALNSTLQANLDRAQTQQSKLTIELAVAHRRLERRVGSAKITQARTFRQRDEALEFASRSHHTTKAFMQGLEDRLETTTNMYQEELEFARTQVHSRDQHIMNLGEVINAQRSIEHARATTFEEHISSQSRA